VRVPEFRERIKEFEFTYLHADMLGVTLNICNPANGPHRLVSLLRVPLLFRGRNSKVNRLLTVS
jgi:hypothetical protein